MSTRSPRNGTPSASSRRRWRSPFASDPSARTIRCQGTLGSSQTLSTAPAKRGAPGETSPYARTKPGGVSRIRRRTACSRSLMQVSSRAVRHGTYSIVAFDPETGEHGAAVHSHWFSVGSLCIWARPGIGAVATQSVVEQAHGPHGLDRLAAGDAAQDALAALLGPDELAAVRQVGIVDAAGRVAVHTGADCIPCAGDAVGANVSAQANMMARDTVPQAMVAGFEAAEGDLADRLLAALDAAEGEGGDVRGRQSSALVVVPPQGEAWQARFELRVEDHADPVTELRRLVQLARAYELAGQADELLASDRPAEAGELYERAAALAPESDELLFWAGLAQAHTGDAAARDRGGAPGDRDPPGLARPARASLAGLRPRGGARPARDRGSDPCRAAAGIRPRCGGLTPFG